MSGKKSGKLTIVGLGYGAPEALTLGAFKVLQEAETVFFRTHEHPTVAWLREQGISGESFDHFYEEAADFESVYRQIAESLSQLVLTGKSLVYAVPGSPWVAEKSVRLLVEKGEELGFEVQVITSVGGLDAVYERLKIDPTDGLSILDGLDLPATYPGQALLITQVYSRLVASQVKLWLLEYLDGEQEITVVKAAGVDGEERIATVPLYELDRLDWLDHLTSVYVPAAEAGQAASCAYPMDPLVEVMAKLRSEEGCPWDRKQTHESLKPYMLEESYEVWDAIDSGNPDKLCDELGDLLLQVVFHAQIASENHQFDMNDVVEAITSKLVRRHPHVFGKTKVNGVKDVMVNWEAIKKQEKHTGERHSALDGVPNHLAGLAKAQKLQSKAAKVGFAWPNWKSVWVKLQEELAELEEVISGPESPRQKQRVEEELGDVLLVLANLARYIGVEAEVAVNTAIAKFERRFRWLEEQVSSKGQKMQDLSLDELLKWWAKSKEAMN
ncbi:MAG: nucleoside triphosphate pyrophosphohydrolase [Firmicutes bacterium]|nr:nucleoside triphosphate pyrophosphohydrolase [Bacillota bacterium]